MNIFMTIDNSINNVLPQLKEISSFLFENPETGGKEISSSNRLISWLSEKGFTTENNYYNIPYAFKATYQAKKNGPTIGLFAEYDALPEIGHGCGHNLIAATTLGSSYGLKSVIDEIGGKIIVYGTPGEENIGCKSIMAPKGAFDEVDIALMAHPLPTKTTVGGRTLAKESLEIKFYGKTSHAGLAPEDGINALDAAVYFYQMVNTQKQYFPDTNVHGIFLNGGEAANIIPDFASLHFITRAWDNETIFKLHKMLEDCAKAAAILNGCTYSIVDKHVANAALRSNKTLTQVFEKYLCKLGDTVLYDDLRASTDMGDVSLRVPTIHPWIYLPNSGDALHHLDFAKATVSANADDYILKASKALAFTAAEILQDKYLLGKIKEEFHNIHYSRKL